MKVHRYGFKTEEKHYSLDELTNLAEKYLILESQASYIANDKFYHEEQGTGAVTVRSYDLSLDEIGKSISDIRNLFDQYEDILFDSLTKNEIVYALWHFTNKRKKYRFVSKSTLLTLFTNQKRVSENHYFHVLSSLLADKKKATA